MFELYLKEINAAYLAGEVTEHTHRPALKRLVEGLGKHISAINQPKQMTGVGAPDMKISRRKGRTDLAFGYIECKDIGVDLKKAID